LYLPILKYHQTTPGLRRVKILHLNQPFGMNKSCKPFFGHLEPFSQDREKGEAPGKTVTGFAGRKKVYRICSRLGERLWRASNSHFIFLF
jgi:hypothetical protein